MPIRKLDASRHLEKARSNYAFYEELKIDCTHLDWAITLLFYSALHLIQAHLVETAVTGFDIPRDHPERDNAVARLLPGVYSHYRFLSSRSQWSRYHVDKPVPTLAVLQGYEDAHFRPIEAALDLLQIHLAPPETRS